MAKGGKVLHKMRRKIGNPTVARAGDSSSLGKGHTDKNGKSQRGILRRRDSQLYNSLAKSSRGKVKDDRFEIIKIGGGGVEEPNNETPPKKRGNRKNVEGNYYRGI